jgi:3',5'-cyclic AMP phosphodiesterase CpdA
MVRVLHVSDLHFGDPSVPEQVDAIETLMLAERFDVVAISGDLTQRAKTEEFLCARAFIDVARSVSRTIVVPGNHDVPWWIAPLGLGPTSRLTRAYTSHIAADMEPTLRVDGAMFVGVNTAHGVTRRTLTWNVRDIGIIGDLRQSHIDRAGRAFDAAMPGDCRIIVMHHNPVRGEISRRVGLARMSGLLERFAEMGVDLILCGHDHQEAAHSVTVGGRRMVISIAGTVSDRSRGGRPSAAHIVTISPATIDVRAIIWSPERQTYRPGGSQCFDR